MAASGWTGGNAGRGLSELALAVLRLGDTTLPDFYSWLLELERRGYHVGWVRVGDDQEVDFHAEQPGQESLLIQVSLDTSADATWDREVRALEAAAAAYPDARPLLITLDATPSSRPLPRRLEWRSAAEWLLEMPAR